jgi:hypothetical protein
MALHLGDSDYPQEWLRQHKIWEKNKSGKRERKPEMKAF